MAYRDDINEGAFGILSVTINESPIRMYLTAERALNKNDSGAYLYWKTGLHRVETYTDYDPNVISDERGRVIRLGFNYDGVESGFLGWIREDELNVPLNVVPLKYHTIRLSDVGKTWHDLALNYDITRDLLRLWNRAIYLTPTGAINDSDIGKVIIVDMGFPPTTDENLFKNEYLENNRYQNAEQSSMVSVKLQGQPNTRYLARTSAPRNPESNNHEVFIGISPSNPNQDLGFSFNEDMVFVTDYTGEIELSFYDSELSGVNADYLDFLDYTYWVEILVHSDQTMTIPPDMTIDDGIVIRSLYNGDNLDTGIVLRPGLNEFTVTGNGKISFHFQKEVMG